MMGVFLSMIETDILKEKFEALYTSCREKAFSIAYSILHDPQLSEDALMDSFFVLAEDMEKIADKTFVQSKNYLYVVVRNRALKIYNSRKKINYVEEIDSSLPDISDVQLEIENREIQQQFFEHIRRMDCKYSDVLILKYFYGFTNTEIAKSLGIEVENVNKRITRAKKQIRETILEDKQI